MAPSRHDWKIVDWDVKPQHNQPTFATEYDEVKTRLSQGRRIVCFGYVYVLTEVQKSSKQWSKTKWYNFFRLSY